MYHNDSSQEIKSDTKVYEPEKFSLVGDDVVYSLQIGNLEFWSTDKANLIKILEEALAKVEALER